MSYINDEDIIDLYRLSRQYQQTLPPQDVAVSNSPTKMSWDDAADVLLSKGWTNINQATGDSMTNESFVLNYIFSD